MRTLFRAGSIIGGAYLAFALTEIAIFARLAFATAGAWCVIYVWSLHRGPATRKSVRVYSSDKEQDQYSEADVREILVALSDAKAKTAAPFPVNVSAATEGIRDYDTPVR